jgi:hypothetical protein
MSDHGPEQELTDLQIDQLETLVNFIEKTIVYLQSMIPFAEPDQQLRTALAWARCHVINRSLRNQEPAFADAHKVAYNAANENTKEQE